jgi:hypothetical protein
LSAVIGEAYQAATACSCRVKGHKKQGDCIHAEQSIVEITPKCPSEWKEMLRKTSDIEGNYNVEVARLRGNILVSA